jgi:hypothetical protein
VFIILNIFSHFDRGMLTGKFKRNQKPDATGSRTGYMQAKREEGQNKSTSIWEEFGDNDAYWKLIEVMEKVAKANGNLSRVTTKPT